MQRLRARSSCRGRSVLLPCFAPRKEKGPKRSASSLFDFPGLSLGLEFDIDAGRQIEMHESIHRLRRGLKNVNQALVRAHLEMFTRLLVVVRRTLNAEPIDLGRQRNGSTHKGASTLRGIHDALGGLIEHFVIERLQTNTNFLLRHLFFSLELSFQGSGSGVGPKGSLSRLPPACLCYSLTAVTTPAPTVRPPSRIAKRRPGSQATGMMSSTSILMLSPGITISTPSGSLIVPVTSVVRK